VSTREFAVVTGGSGGIDDTSVRAIQVDFSGARGVPQFIDASWEAEQRLIGVNLSSTVQLAKAGLPGMLRRGQGWMLFTAFDALMAGKDQVVAGSIKNRAQTAAGKFMTDPVKAAIRAKMMEPQAEDGGQS
jgi:NADP-dependent 3-hydroxy acid dehydrogenase YdfG